MSLCQPRLLRLRPTHFLLRLRQAQARLLKGIAFVPAAIARLLTLQFPRWRRPQLPGRNRELTAWGANIVLVILGYAGIMLAISTLRKIERQTGYAEEAAQAAANSAQAALLHAQALVRAERPWLLVTAEPTPSVQNSYTIIATNRGRSPARLESCLHQITSAAGEAYLPKSPEFKLAKQSAPAESAILLPGEFITITTFSRDEVKDFLQTEERLKQVEDWTEKIYLYGRLTYHDLNAPPEEQLHTTDWCCWYIHGRQKSGMVIAGPPAYNQHT